MNTQLPSLRAGSRRAPLIALLGIGLGQGITAFAVVFLIGRLDDAASRDQTLALLLVLALLLGALKALETVQSETLGQVYVRALRRRLVERLFAEGPEALQRHRRGALWLRLSSDLNGVRQWIAAGLARVFCALPMLAALIAGLAVTQPLLALLALAALAAVGGLALALRSTLHERERGLRRARGRLAGHVDDCLGALADPRAAHDARLDTLRRRSRDVADASVARARLHGALRGTTETVTLLAVVAALAWALTHGGDALSALALFGMLTAPLRDLARAWELRQSHVVAGARLRALLAGSSHETNRDSSTLAPGAPADLPFQAETTREIPL